MDKDQVRKLMEEVLHIFREDIATIRVGRATPALLEDLQVAVYEGQPKMKVIELGNVSVESARSLVFQPWDKSIIKEIKNAILESSSGLTAIVSGEVIRIELPTLTEEQRQDYLKLLHKKLEGARVMIRNIRSDTRSDLQNSFQKGDLSEDYYHRLEEDLQKLTDEYTGKLEDIAEVKEKEIRGVN